MICSAPFPNCRGGQTRLFWLGIVMAVMWVALALSGVPAKGQSLDAGYVTVQMGTVTPHLEAYGKIEPSATLRISFGESGVVAGLKVQPGENVQAGQELAHLKGPEIRSTILKGEANVRSARARLFRLQKSLSSLRQEPSSDRSEQEAVHRAESAVAQAHMRYENALSHLRAVRQMMILRAPVNGTVLMLYAMDAEGVSAGLPALSLETPFRLRLTAHYDGIYRSAIRPGMKGTFSPVDGSQSIPLRVLAVSTVLGSGGGETVTMVPKGRGSRWIDGEVGKVKWDLPKRMLVAVPTRALILDQGKWWVMVHTPQGDHPQVVVPGPSRGWQTFLKAGLSPGAQVEVENAYLLFHRNISRHYQPPD